MKSLKLIDVILYEGGGIGCQETSCPYKRECANHVTAGDYRSEDGFRPAIANKEGRLYCKTYYEESTCLVDANSDDEGWYHWGDFPKNYRELGNGHVLQKDLHLSGDFYQI